MSRYHTVSARFCPLLVYEGNIWVDITDIEHTAVSGISPNIPGIGGSSQFFLIGFLLHFYNSWVQLENTNKTKKKIISYIHLKSKQQLKKWDSRIFCAYQLRNELPTGEPPPNIPVIFHGISIFRINLEFSIWIFWLRLYFIDIYLRGIPLAAKDVTLADSILYWELKFSGEKDIM